MINVAMTATIPDTNPINYSSVTGEQAKSGKFNNLLISLQQGLSLTDGMAGNTAMKKIEPEAVMEANAIFEEAILQTGMTIPEFQEIIAQIIQEIQNLTQQANTEFTDDLSGLKSLISNLEHLRENLDFEQLHNQEGKLEFSDLVLIITQIFQTPAIQDLMMNVGEKNTRLEDGLKGLANVLNNFLNMLKNVKPTANNTVSMEQIETLQNILNKISSNNQRQTILENVFSRSKTDETSGKVLLPFQQSLLVTGINVKETKSQGTTSESFSKLENRIPAANTVNAKADASSTAEPRIVLPQSTNNTVHVELKNIIQSTANVVPDDVVSESELKSTKDQTENGKEISLMQKNVGANIPLATQPKLEMLQLLDSEGKPISFERFVKNFESILSRGSFQNNGQVQKLTIQLFPENLGTLKIELVQNQHELVAKIVSSTQTGKELLEGQLAALKQAFQQQNLNFVRIDVENQMQQEKNQQHQQQQSHQQQRNEEETGHHEQDVFGLSFEEALLNYEI